MSFIVRDRSKMPNLQSEADLLKQVLGWLTLKKVFHWRANAGGGLRRGRPIKGNPAGTPDVLAVVPWDVGDGAPFFRGMLVGIECKAGAGKLRPAQAAWKANAERAGVLYLEVRSLQQLIDAMEKEGVIV